MVMYANEVEKKKKEKEKEKIPKIKINYNIYKFFVGYISNPLGRESRTHVPFFSTHNRFIWYIVILWLYT